MPTSVTSTDLAGAPCDHIEENQNRLKFEQHLHEASSHGSCGENGRCLPPIFAPPHPHQPGFMKPRLDPHYWDRRGPNGEMYRSIVSGSRSR